LATKERGQSEADGRHRWAIGGSWPGPGFQLGPRKLTLAGRTHALKVSLPAWFRTHTAGHERKFAKVCFGRRTLVLVMSHGHV